MMISHFKGFFNKPVPVEIMPKISQFTNLNSKKNWNWFDKT